MSEPWEDFSQGAKEADAPTSEAGPWEDFQRIDMPYEQAQFLYPETRGVFKNSEELLRAVVNDPKSIPKIAAGLGMAPFEAAGKIVNAALQDAGAVTGANPEGFGNVKAVLEQTPADDSKLPYEQTLSDISKEHPVVSTAGKIAAGTAEAAPMMAAGLPAGALGRLISLGFSADMLKSGGEAATQLGEEMGKNPEDRDADKVTSAVSSLIQSGAFGTLAGAHGLKPGVIGELSLQLLKDPKVYPADKAPTPIVSEEAGPWNDFKQPEAGPQPEQKVEQPKTPDPNWRVTVQPDEVDNGKLIPSGYVQIDDITGGQNVWSKSPATLAKEGIEVPDFSKLPKGQYTFSEAEQLLEKQKSSPSPEEQITAPTTPPAESAAPPEQAPAAEETKSGLNAPEIQKTPEELILSATVQRTGKDMRVILENGETNLVPGTNSKKKALADTLQFLKLRENLKPTEASIQAPVNQGLKIELAQNRPVPTVEQAKTSYSNLPMSAVGAIHEWETNQKIIDTGIGADGSKVSKKHITELLARQPQVVENFNREIADANPISQSKQGNAPIQEPLMQGAKFNPATNIHDARKRVADFWRENAKAIRAKDEHASHVTAEQKDKILADSLRYADEIEQGKHDGNFTIGQRINYELTGKSVPLLPPESEPKRIGMGAAIPEEFESSQNSPTATKNATIERERAARGLPPAMEPARRSFGQVWDNAMAMIDRDPGIQDSLIAELSKNPRAVTDTENAMLLHRQIELQNEYGKLTQDIAQAYDDAKEFPNRMADVEELKPRIADVTDRLFELYEINKKVGTETGRGLNARKMMAYEDYTLAKMELDARAANGGRPLTESEHEKVKELHDRIDRLRKEFDAYSAKSQERISELEAENALKELKSKPEPPVEPHIRIIADKIKNYFDSRAVEAQKRLAGKTFSFEAALPDLIDLGVSTILSGAADFTIWSSRMLEKLDKSIEPYLETLWEKSNKALDEHISKSSAPHNEPKVKRAARTPKTVQDRQKNVETKLKKRIQDGKLDEISAYVRKFARILIESGITDRDKLIDAIHEKLNEFDPSITRRQTMDAISGYGDFKQLSKDEISKQLRDLKGQMQQIAKLEDMQAGQPPLKTGLERRIPSKEESRLIKLVNEAKREFQIPITDPNTQLKSALDTLKTRMQTRIEELRQKIADQDFLPRPQREPLKLDREALRIKADYERAKLEFERALQQYRLNNRNTLEKVSDTLVKWRRGFLLSSPITLAKLTSAAIQRLSITPAEEAIGGVISSFIPRVAEKAQREGGLNTKAEAKAITEAFTTGMKDAWETLKTGTSPLDVLYGQGREGYVRESMSLPRSVIDFFGNTHAALKAPVKRAEFARAFEKRIAAAIRAGIDVSDPMVQTRIAVESYKDSNRSIFLQDNRLVTAYKMFLAGLEQKNKETGKPTVGGKLGATAGRLALPIVRVPTNIVAETFTYAFGSMTGAARLANAFAKGMENLKPNEADLIMRELKKGSLGAVALLLGYFNSNNLGGYYQPGQKREKGDVKFGNVKLFGHEIPSFLVHNPLLEVLQLGATIRRVEESKMKGEAQGLPTGIMAGALGLADEVPFVREMFGEIPKMFNPREQGSFMGELAKSVFIPQLLQWLANQSDKDQSGNTKPRSPQTAWQHIETGIPGLRKNVPEKKSNQLPQ